MKILILGAGGIGGYFGAHLIRAGADITYLVRASRKALIDTNGLSIETPRGNFVVHPNTVTANNVKAEYDLILLAPKSYDLEDALKSLLGVLERGVVLPFLNGLDHLDLLDKTLGRERVMGGVAHIAATMTPEGAVRRLTDMHRLTFGARHESHQGLVQGFFDLCEKTPFDRLISNNIEQVLWDKWTFLATLAGMTTLCRGSVGEIVSTSYGAEATIAMYEECCQVANNAGHPVGDGARSAALAMLTEQGSNFSASMLRDLLDGLRTEHDHILGAMVRRGQKVGCQTPLIRLAFSHLEVQATRRLEMLRS